MQTQLAEYETNESHANDFSYWVEPFDSKVTLSFHGQDITVSQGGLPAENFSVDEGVTTWNYPASNFAVRVEKVDDYLSLKVTSKELQDGAISFPIIDAPKYYMPLWEGKQFWADDSVWVEYLAGSEVDMLESFSMPFFSTSHGDIALVYIFEDIFRNKIVYDQADVVKFSVVQEFAKIDSKQEKTIRVYLVPNNPKSVAKIYRDYVVEQGEFLTLTEKAEQNPNIKKLYGAPHIYLSSSYIIATEDINWRNFIASLDNPIMQHLLSFTDKTEVSNEVQTVLTALKQQDYIDNYQKNVLCKYITEVLQRNDFYQKDKFPKHSDLLDAFKQDSNVATHIDLNREALAINLPNIFPPSKKWMDSRTVDVLNDMKSSGINTAWIGLHSWEQAYMKPELAQVANELGYLIAPYDSYHSIQPPNNEQWITAKFNDSTLYDSATIKNSDGEYIKGFKNIGRKLNPTLTIAVVDERVGQVTGAENNFNSWFVDCDATGEIYDDYYHNTTMQEDLLARLERMALIRDKYNMVIGSEGGKGFAIKTIAFAHGIEVPAFSWMDNDMRFNKSSEYYQGAYYNPNGGVPFNFSKRIPLKKRFYELFLNPAYDIPLFKLVYNDALITTYHWGWSTFKFKGLTADRMLREVLYNVPPLYQLDDKEWANYKDEILAHNVVWSNFSKKVINLEMTDFQNLTKDGKVQLTQYGCKIRVVANFSNLNYTFENQAIPSHSLLIDDSNEQTIYTPKLNESSQ